MASRASMTCRVVLQVGKMKRTTLLQGAIWEPTTRKWYLAQARTAGKYEHTYIRRFSETGRYESWMLCKYAGHGMPFGLRRSAAGNIWAWIPWGKSGSTKRAARVRFQPGKTITSRNRFVEQFGPKTGTRGAFAVEWPYLVVRRGQSKTETYIRYREDEFRSKGERAHAYAKITISKGGRPGPFQGVTARGDELWVLSGKTGKAIQLDCFSFKSGKRTRSIRFSGANVRQVLKARSGGGFVVPQLSSYEPEGLCWVGSALYMGLRTGPGNSRRGFALVEVRY